MNANDVIAANVKRLRKERGFTGEQLARILGVKPHVVYDYEGPRKGRPQREFLWREIVSLAIVFDVRIYDLVLPAHDVELDDFKPENTALRHAAKTAGAPSLFDRDSRAMMLRRLFGIEGDQTLRPLYDKSAEARELKQQIVEDIANQLHEWSQS